MRKIFSTVLVATALLFSMQANAATSVGSEDALRSALANGGEIVLTSDIQLNAPLQIAESYANNGKVITLDLGGKTLSNNPAKKIGIIELFKGTLTIKNGTIKCSYPAWQDSCKDAITVHGVYQDNAKWSNLTIAKDARVEAEKNAITVMEFYGKNIAYFSGLADANEFVKYYTLGANGQVEMFNGGQWNGPTLNLAQANQIGAYYFYAYVDTAIHPRVNPGMDSLLSHSTDTVAANKYVKKATKTTAANIWGWQKVATKAQTDLVKYPYGMNNVTIAAFKDFAGAARPDVVDYTSSVPSYAHKGEWFQSGIVPVKDANKVVIDTTAYIYYKNCYKTAGEYAKANGVNITVDGYVYGAKYGIKVNGVLRYADTNLPYILVSESAEVACAPNTQEGLKDKESTAIYCSGKAKWEIKGNVHGNIGVTVKGGEVVIDGATITGTGEGYQSVTAGGSGINGGSGCGILVSSQTGYIGDQTVTIKGDSKVTANDGFAINETVPAGDKDNENKVTSITVEGGTITGGDQGAMVFTDEGAGVTTIVGGNVEGSTHVGDDPEDKLDSLKATGTFIVEMEIGGSTVFIVTKGTQPTDTVSINATLPDSANIIVKEEHVKITENKVFGYVQMPNKTSDTIASGVTIRIGKLVMGDEAQFVIMPGAKLIVYGEQGVVAGMTSNLVIKADSTGMGTFLFNPAVTSNRTPMATVEFYAKTFDVFGDTKKYKWDIMVSPFKTITALNAKTSDGKMSDYLWAYQYWNGKKWVRYANKAALVESATAFQPIALGNSSPKSVYTIYTFQGELQGNISGEFNLERGYNFMGNGYVAPMDSKSIIEEAVKAGNVESALYIWNFDRQNYDTYTLDNVSKMPNMNALGFFILKANSDVKVNLNYNKLIWEYNNK